MPIQICLRIVFLILSDLIAGILFGYLVSRPARASLDDAAFIQYQQIVHLLSADDASAYVRSAPFWARLADNTSPQGPIDTVRTCCWSRDRHYRDSSDNYFGKRPDQRAVNDVGTSRSASGPPYDMVTVGICPPGANGDSDSRVCLRCNRRGFENE
jgi:hypothetical protein